MQLKDISDKIQETIQEAGLDIQKLSWQEMIDRQVGFLQRPVVNISINAGTWTKVTLRKYKVKLIIALFLTVQNLRGEKDRRYDIYGLIDGIVNLMVVNKMGLEMQDPIKPGSFSNVTDAKYSGAGYQIYQLNFTGSYIHEMAEEDLGMLRSLVSKYNDDATEYTLNMGIVYGGSAYVSGPASLEGGHAQQDYVEAVWGGNAGSSYNN
jgi:hypothetical protein